jgi:hypothetical protein
MSSGSENELELDQLKHFSANPQKTSQDLDSEAKADLACQSDFLCFNRFYFA